MTRPPFLLVLLLAFAACDDDDTAANTDAGTTPDGAQVVDDAIAGDMGAGDMGAADAELPPDMDPGPPLPSPYEDCDPLVPQSCAMPWPSNLYLAEDDTRETGYTVTFGATTLPANILEDHIALLFADFITHGCTLIFSTSLAIQRFTMIIILMDLG